MPEPITLENDTLKIQVLPNFGGKITSLVDKADQYDLLFSYPCPPNYQPTYALPYHESWYAGWDECFPAVARGTYPAFPHDSTPIPDHGELWSIPTTLLPSADGITLVWHGVRFGYRFTRHLRLIGNTLEATYELENFTPAEFRFVWAQHALMALDTPVRFANPDLQTWRWARKPGHGFTWPTSSTGADISRPSELPADDIYKAFSVQPIEQPFRVQYPARHSQVAISYQSDSGIAAYWGVWINTGGWCGRRHFAIEPTTGHYDALTTSIEDNSAARVGALAKAQWQVRWTFSAM